MTPTTAAHRTIEELEREITEARDAMADAERELEAADAAVEEARQSESIGLVARGFRLRAQVQRARRSETFELARSRVSAIERLANAERERIAGEAARAAGLRNAELRAQGQALAGQLGAFLARTLSVLASFEDEFARHNAEEGQSVHYRLRPISDFTLLNDRLLDTIYQLQRAFPAPKPPAATTSAERDRHV